MGMNMTGIWSMGCADEEPLVVKAKLVPSGLEDQIVTGVRTPASTGIDVEATVDEVERA